MIVGRGSGANISRIIITCNGKEYHSSNPGSVPVDVSRNHCRILFGDDGRMIVENLTPANLMYVNGMDCRRKGNVFPSDRIELGPSRYRLHMETIIKDVSTSMEFSLVHLKEIYEDFQEKKQRLYKRKERQNALSMIPAFFSTASLIVFVLYSNKEMAGYIRAVLLFIVLLGSILIFVFRLMSAGSFNKENDRLKREFEKQYICPNPACRFQFGADRTYERLIDNRVCPHCNCRFTD